MLLAPRTVCCIGKSLSCRVGQNSKHSWKTSRSHLCVATAAAAATAQARAQIRSAGHRARPRPQRSLPARWSAGLPVCRPARRPQMMPRFLLPPLFSASTPASSRRAPPPRSRHTSGTASGIRWPKQRRSHSRSQKKQQVHAFAQNASSRSFSHTRCPRRTTTTTTTSTICSLAAVILALWPSPSSSSSSSSSSPSYSPPPPPPSSSSSQSFELTPPDAMRSQAKGTIMGGGERKAFRQPNLDTH